VDKGVVLRCNGMGGEQSGEGGDLVSGAGGSTDKSDKPPGGARVVFYPVQSDANAGGENAIHDGYDANGSITDRGGTGADDR
jgi:hypothetical protein